MTMHSTTPVFRIFDEDKAREFYVEFLGDELLAKGYKFARPGIDDTPWGTREMSVRDPFGNRLTFVAAVTASEA